MHSFMKDLGEQTWEKVFKAVSFGAFALCIVHSFYANWVETTGRGDVFRNQTSGFLFQASLETLPTSYQASTACCICDQQEGEPVIGDLGASDQCGKGCRRVNVGGNECKFYTVAARGDGYSCTPKRITTEENIAVLPPESASPCQQQGNTVNNSSEVPADIAVQEENQDEGQAVSDACSDGVCKPTIEGNLSSLTRKLIQ